MVGEHVFDDVDDAFVLPDAAVQGMAQQRDPGLDDQGLAGQAAVGVKAAGFGDVAAATRAAAVGQGGMQRDGPGVELLEFDMGVEYEGVQFEPEGLGNGLGQHEALDHQVGRQRALCAHASEGVETGVGLPGGDQPAQQAAGAFCPAGKRPGRHSARQPRCAHAHGRFPDVVGVRSALEQGIFRWTGGRWPTP